MEAIQALHELFQGTCYETDKLRRTALFATAMAGQPVCRAMKYSGILPSTLLGRAFAAVQKLFRQFCPPARTPRELCHPDPVSSGGSRCGLVPSVTTARYGRPGERCSGTVLHPRRAKQGHSLALAFELPALIGGSGHPAPISRRRSRPSKPRAHPGNIPAPSDLKRPPASASVPRSHSTRASKPRSP